MGLARWFRPIRTRQWFRRLHLTIIDAQGWNDERSTLPILTPAAYRAIKTAWYDEIAAACPGIGIVIAQHMPCRAEDPAGAPSQNLAATNALIAANNTTTNVQLRDYAESLGLHAYAAGSFNYPVAGSNDLVRSDNIHEVDGPTGDDNMAPPLVAGLLVVKPA